MLKSDVFGVGDCHALGLQQQIAQVLVATMVALGRKNWIHIGSPQAGPKVAAILSIVETCRRIHIPVREYLAAVLPGLGRQEPVARSGAPVNHGVRLTLTLEVRFGESTVVPGLGTHSRGFSRWKTGENPPVVRPTSYTAISFALDSSGQGWIRVRPRRPADTSDYIWHRV